MREVEMFSEEILTKPNCSVPGASKVYDLLVDFVEQNYSAQSKEHRAIIFALAYSKICHLKKEDIGREYIINPTKSHELEDNKRLITRVCGALSHQDIFRRHSEEAKSTLASLRQSLFEETLYAVTTNFGTLETNIKTALGVVDINTQRSIAALAPVPVPVKIRTHWERLGSFFEETLYEALRYPFVLIAALLILGALGWIMSFIAPFVLHAFVEAVEKLIEPLKNATK